MLPKIGCRRQPDVAAARQRPGAVVALVRQRRRASGIRPALRPPSPSKSLGPAASHITSKR